jgi:hypothetical protein
LAVVTVDGLGVVEVVVAADDVDVTVVVHREGLVMLVVVGGLLVVDDTMDE